MKVLETERLILGKWHPRKDAKDLFEYAKGPNVGPNAGWAPHESVADSKMRIKKVFLRSGIWKITLKGEGKAIGSIGFENDNRRIDMKSKELGYSLSEEYWGRGIMTEAGEAVLRYAFEELKLDVVSIVTTPDNKRSQRVIEKLGFTYEGTLREGQMTYNGKIKDTMCFSMLRREWEAAHPGAGRCEDGEER
jgi:putative acetyltransferase